VQSHPSAKNLDDLVTLRASQIQKACQGEAKAVPSLRKLPATNEHIDWTIWTIDILELIAIVRDSLLALLDIQPIGVEVTEKFRRISYVDDSPLLTIPER
jgi:hypothetical protein